MPVLLLPLMIVFWLCELVDSCKELQGSEDLTCPWRKPINTLQSHHCSEHVEFSTSICSLVTPRRKPLLRSSHKFSSVSTPLLNCKIYYRIQIRLRLVPVINHISPTHDLINLFRIYSNIIFPFTPSSPKWCESIWGNSYCLLLNLLNGLKGPSRKTVAPSAAKYKTHHTTLHVTLDLTTKFDYWRTFESKSCAFWYLQTL
jgi:hypothetical protein